MMLKAKKVPGTGLEPAHLAASDLESDASTNSATPGMFEILSRAISTRK